MGLRDGDRSRSKFSTEYPILVSLSKWGLRVSETSCLIPEIYNLCIEEEYDTLHFHGRVEKFPFDDNHVPNLEMVKSFCESVYSWLSSDPKNIAVIHCMAGKGRTGLMVCAYLVYTGMSAEEALHLYAQKRTTNNQGVSIPSQRRYVEYWESVLSFPRGIGNGPPDVNLPPPCSRELRRIRLYDTINTTSVFFVVSELQEIPNQRYRPPVEVAKNCCREIKKGYEGNSSPRYFLSYLEGNKEGIESEPEEPHVVYQMDTESPVLYQKTCLDYHFNKPVISWDAEYFGLATQDICEEPSRVFRTYFKFTPTLWQ
ncbi:hypothetical protein CCACVL1_08802 [Corchorus capsularis]|uniref:Uncharacterized protein n=1 Tax=Corchorus capsularis TaxID=210143 RepID=A0A1R3IYU7_COCAP|nr:hypothetical protein CCACVL1_08802 [Corchorus capsularis]